MRPSLGDRAGTLCRRELGMAAALVFAAAMLCGAGAHGQRTFYVDRSHVGAALGTSQNPFTSIAAGLAQTRDGRGDTVVVRPGTYVERVVVWPGTQLISEEGAANTFLLGNPSTEVNVVELDNGAVLRGFTIGDTGGAAVHTLLDAAAEMTNCVLFDSATGILADSGGRLACRNNTIYSNVVGVTCGAGGAVMPFENNVVSENGLAISMEVGATVDSDYSSYFQNGVFFEGPFQPGDNDFASNPLFADKVGLNFHLRLVSNLRDAGNPNSADNDRDNTRNDVGADGGPYGTLDALAPMVLVQTQPNPPEGEPPFALLFNGSASWDAWGIYTWEWDFNAFDGFSVQGTGASIARTYSPTDQPGGYLVTLRVTDNAGVSSEARVNVRVGSPPRVTVGARPKVGPAPLAVDFNGVATSEKQEDTLRFEWDFFGDGFVDSTEEAPAFTYPANTGPGLYRPMLTVFDGNEVFTQKEQSITITEFPVAVSKSLGAGEAGELVIDDDTSNVAGTRVTVPVNALNEAMTVALGAANLTGFPLAPQGELLAALELSPAGVRFAQFVEIEVPIDGPAPNAEDVAVQFYEPISQAWLSDGIERVRVKVDEEADQVSVSFDTSHFTVFALTRAKADTEEPPTGCTWFNSAKKLPAPGELFLGGMAFIALFASTALFRTRE